MIKKSDLRTGKKAIAVETTSKKRDIKAEEKKELVKLEVRDYLLENEKRIHSRNSVLQC